jgi:hypothetical protein
MKELREAIATLLAADVGYSIDLFGLLTVMRLEDGRFAVSSYEYDPETGSCDPTDEQLFTDPLAAATVFEAMRAERLLGYEYEHGEDDPGRR